jgi:hypothetical protein
LVKGFQLACLLPQGILSVFLYPSLGILGETNCLAVGPSLEEQKSVAEYSYLELEREISKLSMAMATRNRQVGLDLIAGLSVRLNQQDLAGIILVSLERLMWLDVDALLWAVDSLIPKDLMQEIHKLTSVTMYKQLIRKGFVPGQDLSVDADGKLLISDRAKTAVVQR